MKHNVFREYDIRGIVSTELVIEEMGELTQAIVTYFKEQDPLLTTVVVGMDGRLHSQPIKERVIAAIRACGINVVDIGVCPTPVFYFSLFQGHATSGLMITASHNPSEYNGIKLCCKQQSVWGEEIQIIRRLFENKHFLPEQRSHGSLTTLSINEDYISFLTHQFAHLKNKSFNIVVDCANGTAGTILPSLVKAMGWRNVTLLYEEVDGTFPNHEADPTIEKNMRALAALLKKTGARLGIGFDGDCDRMAPLSESGYLVPGDKLLALYSRQVLEHNPGAAVVFDIKSSQGLIEMLSSLGAQLCISPSGHSCIKNTMKRHKALLGGELSCHFFFHDRYFGYDDGIYAMMRLCEILEYSGSSLDELIRLIPSKISSDEIRLLCDEDKKRFIVEDIKAYLATQEMLELITIDGVRVQTKDGWGLARVSNTQPVISLRFESETHEGLLIIKKMFAGALQKHFSADVILMEMGI